MTVDTGLGINDESILGSVSSQGLLGGDIAEDGQYSAEREPSNERQPEDRLEP
jgi:hypothetical protein